MVDEITDGDNNILMSEVVEINKIKSRERLQADGAVQCAHAGFSEEQKMNKERNTITNICLVSSTGQTGTCLVSHKLKDQVLVWMLPS